MTDEPHGAVALDRDPLVIKAREYSEIVRGLCSVLDPSFAPEGNATAGAAMGAIASHGLALGGTVHRACLAGWPSDENGERFAGEGRSDAARLARLMIRESRKAWAVLMQPPHAIGDGVPARMIARLDELDEGVAARLWTSLGG